ncbi:MAG: hypothetical protein H7263_06005, partial [Candidatus Sericytochromatia bacterium]|nr:hypothetical protein [Candidatus Sericytochromatia bacterium]
MSDIGLTYKKGFNQEIIFATDLITAKPKNGVKITLRSNQNQILDTKTTNDEGKAEFTDIKEDIFYVEGEKDSQRSVIQTAGMEWNLSTFDTGGDDVQDDGTRAFIYTERGVYRPGDTINVSIIARNEDNTFPDNHPMTIKVYNPLNQLISEQTKKDGKEGFYSFAFNTNENDMTGNWGVDLIAGTKTFHHSIKVETVIPNRLKVKFDNPKKELLSTDKSLKFNLISTYLFGNPAANLDSEIKVTLKNSPKQFKKYPNFTFTNESIDYKEYKENIFKNKLNNDGKASISWNLPNLNKTPSAIEADISAKVMERGGRDTENNLIVPINPYQYYVGLQNPNNNGYSKIGDNLNIKAVLLDTDGKSIKGKQLKYKIYKNNRHWWWEYDSQNKYRLHYKSDTQTEVIKEGKIISDQKPVNISFKPDEGGEYFVEVQDVSNLQGHIAGFFFSASYWGEQNASTKDDGILSLKSDKKTYNIGDKAVISFPIPEKAQYLISIEKGNKILKTYWYDPAKGKEAKVEVPVTKEMMPTSYFSVSVIQPHSQTANDRPIRMYGVIPINIEDSATHQYIDLKVASELQAKKNFDVEIQTKDKQPTQFTIAVVDDGLLDLTNFATPDPWKEFYKKLRLGVITDDLFSYVIGANTGDIFKTFSVGGDLDYRINQQELKKAKRFKLVSMFKAPMMTDENGHAKVSFMMPEYLGSVRVMVTSAKGNRYASVEKSIPVKSDLMILPTLPRVLSPLDSVVVPVTIFATKDNIRNVNVSVKTEGAISIDGENTKSVSFDKAGDKDVFFKLNAMASQGNAKIIITANSGNFSESSTTEINVRPSSPRIFQTETKQVNPGELVSFNIPNRGISGSNHSILNISRKAKLNINNRLEYLIDYPYGCVEQTVS